MSSFTTYMNWSSGKDSALALYDLLQDKNYQVGYLLTSVNAHHERVSMHGLRRSLLEAQTRSIGIPAGCIELPEQPDNKMYEDIVGKKVMELKELGFEYAAFGDIFLEDLKAYREQQLSRLGIKAVFPLWKKDTRVLLEQFIDLGFKAVVICVNADLLPSSFAGRLIDRDFINDLPGNVDICGENGEFHTFCFDGPIFKDPVTFTRGETVLKTYLHEGQESRFWFTDLLPVE